MKIIGFGNSTGSKYWRLIHPFKYLARLGHEAFVSDEGITEKALEWADLVVLNSITYKEGLALVRQYQVEKGLKLVVDCDDWGELNDDHPYQKQHEVNEAKFVIGRMMQVADLVTCTTKHLGREIADMNKNIKVLPNYMDLEFWNKGGLKNTGEKLRIGWAGSSTHLNDLKYIVPALQKLYEEYPITYVFVGEPRMADLMKPVPVEIVMPAPSDVWPTQLAGLRLDIGLAPLLDTPFNRNKSNIKWQEYSVNKIPAVFSPTVYRFRGFDPKFGVVAEDQDHWYRAIKHLIDFPQRRQEIAEASYLCVTKNYSLEKRIGLWEKAYLDTISNK